MKLRDKFDELPDEALIDGNTVDIILDQSRTTRWRRIKAGVLPPPVKLPGSHVGRWTVGGIRKVLADFVQAA